MSLLQDIAIGTAGVIGTGVGLAASVTINVYTNSLDRSLKYLSNSANPNLKPGPDEVIRLYYNGIIDHNNLTEYLWSQGIETNTDNMNGNNASWWKMIIAENVPLLPTDVAMRAWAIDRMTLPQIQDQIRRAGHGDPFIRDILLTSSPSLDANSILSLYRRQDINADKMSQLLRHAGVNDSSFRDLIALDRQGPSIANTLELWNRGVIDSVQVDKYLSWNDVVSVPEQERIKEFANTLPGMGQIVSFAQKDIWNEQYAAAFGLDQDMPPEFAEFAAENGMDWSRRFQDANGNIIDSLNWMKALWRSTWRQLSIGEAAEMYNRLRPTGGPNNGPRIPGVNPFTRQQMGMVVGVNNYPPAVVDAVIAMSKRVPSRLFISRLFGFGIIDKVEVAERFQDIGYSKNDADKLADMTEHDMYQKRVAKLAAITRQQVADGYRVGTLSRQDAAIKLQTIFLSDYSKQGEYLLLNRQLQIQQALGNPFVTLTLDNIDLAWTTNTLKGTINAIKQAFLRIEIEPLAATDMLVNVGITQQRATQYVVRWQQLLIGRGHEPVAGAILTWYRDGIIDRQTAAYRLNRLGFSNYDMNASLTVADIARAKMAAQTVAANERQQASKQRALIAAQKQLDNAKRKTQAALARSASKSAVLKFLKQGTVTVQQCYNRLTAMGVLPLDALAFIKGVITDANNAAVKQIEKAAKEASKGNAPTA